MLKEWRANLAAHDILKKQLQDSLIVDLCKQVDNLTELSEQKQRVINDYAGITNERLNMIMAQDGQINSYRAEVVRLKATSRKYRKQRNIAAGIGVLLLGLIAVK